MRSFFAVFCALLLMPTLASAELISITELVQETPEAWIEEIDVNGKTISIDAPIYVPEVETLPVLKVTMIEANDDAVQAYVNDGWKVVEGYPEYRYGVRIYKENENVSDENLHQHEYEIANDYWQFERTHDLDEVYAQNQEKPIGEFARMMEKMFAVLCALLLVPTIASAGGERISVSELKAQTPAAVEGTHEAYGRTISFRAPVYVPDVDTLPILRVKRTCISAQTAEALGDSLEKNTLYGQRTAMRPGGLAESEASHFTAYVQNLWTSAADEAAIFAPNQEKSLRDAEDFLARQTETLLGEQQIGCLPYRAGLRSERLVRDGAKKGGYYIEAWETLRGIPVVTGVERTFSRQSGRAVQQALSNASWIVLGEYRSDADYIWMATAMWREIGEVQPDVPLCGWAQVERTLTDWIERGRIRDVYSVTLGYAAYAAPDRKYPDDETAYEAEYWLAPTWCVECKYAESAAKALTADGAEEDETEARGYQQEKGWTILLIDARTGRMIDPEDETAGRYVYAL